MPICPFIGLSVYWRRPVPICPFIGLSVYRRRPEKTGRATTLYESLHVCMKVCVAMSVCPFVSMLACNIIYTVHCILFYILDI